MSEKSSALTIVEGASGYKVIVPHKPSRGIESQDHFFSELGEAQRFINTYFTTEATPK